MHGPFSILISTLSQINDMSLQPMKSIVEYHKKYYEFQGIITQPISCSLFKMSHNIGITQSSRGKALLQTCLRRSPVSC